MCGESEFLSALEGQIAICQLREAEVGAVTGLSSAEVGFVYCI